jgi:SsrA-binding protein
MRRADEGRILGRPISGKNMSGKKKKDASPGEKLVCTNPKAKQLFEIEERMEAGMVLSGSEVKSLRARRADLEGAYAAVEGDAVVLHKMHIAPYEQAGPYFQHEPKRSRKLLLSRREIERLRGKLSVRGFTLVPIRVYFKGGWAKVELGLGKGKHKADRREDLKKKAADREARAAMQRSKGR